MATPGENTTASKLQYLVPTHWDSTMLEMLKKRVVLWGVADKKPLPKNSGNIIKWSRFSPLGPVNAATQGAQPTMFALSAVNVTATLTQFTGQTTTSDLLEMTAVNSGLMSDIVGQLSYQAALTVDKYIWLNLLGLTAGGVSAVDYMMPAPGAILTNGGLNAKFYNTVTTLSGLGATHVLDIAEINRSVAYLDSLDAMPYDDGNYIGVMDPIVERDLMADTTAVTSWAAWNEYTNPEAMYNHEIGKTHSVRWLKSTNLFTHNSGVGAGATAHHTFIFGKGAFGVVDFDGGVKTYVIPSSQVDSYNPAATWSTVAWKITFASEVLNPSCGLVVITGHVG